MKVEVGKARELFCIEISAHAALLTKFGLFAKIYSMEKAEQNQKTFRVDTSSDWIPAADGLVTGSSS